MRISDWSSDVCSSDLKDAEQRGFHKLAEYQEGRKARGSRDARALGGKRSRHGRREQEIAWKNAEVHSLYRLTAARVRLTQPYGYYEGVMVMERIPSADGTVSHRPNDISQNDVRARGRNEEAGKTGE